MESILALAGLQPEGESERGFRLEYGGGRIRVEAPGVTLERVGMVEDLAKRFPAERTRSNSTPFRLSGRQKTFKLSIPEKWWAAIRQACKRLQRPFQVRRFARPEGYSPVAFGRCRSSGGRGKGLTRRREGAKGFASGTQRKPPPSSLLRVRFLIL